MAVFCEVGLLSYLSAMNQMLKFLTLALLATVLFPCGLMAVDVEDGVSHELALYRASHVRDVRYTLHFTVPDDKDRPVAFVDEMRFVWTGDEDLQIDFQAEADQLDAALVVNGVSVPAVLRDEHVIVPAACLVKGENVVVLRGRSGDKALNRHEDYLYTLFVPDHARSAFPCFDQPDLKARVDLSLTIPEGWVSISNETQRPIPTYLFSFTAGRFQLQTSTRDGRELTALYRETDTAKVAQLPTVFDQVALSLRWMEQYTGIGYPFEKYGFVVLPGYQFGGMEHPGCIQFTDQRIFLGPSPTPDEEMSRLNLIAHETAHMWFGDLVTMRWFDDVWTKEVYANFMADKISREQFPGVNHDLAFVKTHYPLALSTDRTLGSHPIQQPLDNLNQAGLLYGNIIYHKAPVMMSKLEQEKGEIPLREGLRSYLRRYSYGNATWNDLVTELDRFNPEHSAQAFSDVWVRQRGLPTVSATVDRDSLTIIQQDPYGRGLAWRQGFDVGLASARGIEAVPVYMTKSRLAMPMTPGTIPLLNAGGKGYGRFVIDGPALTMLEQALPAMTDEMQRYAAVLNLYENFHLGNVAVDRLFDIFLLCLEREGNELIASTLCNNLNSLLPHLDAERRAQAERQILDLAGHHASQSVRKTLLRQLSVAAVDQGVVAALYTMWNDESPLLNDRDRMTMVYHLAIMMPDQCRYILDSQRARLKNEDERREFDFVSRACSPDTLVQQQLFNDLLQAQNRRVEPWARQLLALLNHPMREPYSNRYLKPGLDALEQVQRTGDIFFPGYWLSALLNGHKSNEASAIVRHWIEANDALNPALMNKLKENAYWLLKPNR